MYSETLREYWETRAQGYARHDVFGRKLLRAYLTRLPFKPRSLIEIGCGKGYIFKEYKDIPRVVGLDYSVEMLAFAQRRVDRHDYNIELIHADIAKESLDEKFDVALTRTCLMHIHPDDIVAAAENISKMSDYLMLLEYSVQVQTGPLAGHNWLHDYFKIFLDLGYTLVEAYPRPDLPQVLFQFKRESKIGSENPGSGERRRD